MQLLMRTLLFCAATVSGCAATVSGFEPDASGTARVGHPVGGAARSRGGRTVLVAYVASMTS
jgi:hypothetical protein